MKMKRFIAESTSQAFQLVSDELGPDALIMSNRKVEEGVEVIAAIDYEDELGATPRASGEAGKEPISAETTSIEAATHTHMVQPEPARETSIDVSLQDMNRQIESLRSMLEAPLSKLVWAEMGRHSPSRARLLADMAKLGLHSVVANLIADMGIGYEDQEQEWQQAMILLEGMLPTADDTLLSIGGIAALIGPTGVGKTTSIAKLAARFALQHGRRQVALVTMDHFRIGAHDQLRTYGKLLGVPVFIAGDQDELKVILDQMSDRKLILIDTAGTSQRDQHLSEQYTTLDIEGVPIKRYLVMSATGQMVLNDEVLNAFSSLKPDRCILTKVDEATSLGGILSVLIKHKLAAVYMGNGQCVPDDFHPLTAKSLVHEMLELADNSYEGQSDDVWLQALGMSGEVAHVHA